jgi:hypothetical protein
MGDGVRIRLKSSSNTLRKVLRAFLFTAVLVAVAVAVAVVLVAMMEAEVEVEEVAAVGRLSMEIAASSRRCAFVATSAFAFLRVWQTSTCASTSLTKASGLSLPFVTLAHMDSLDTILIARSFARSWAFVRPSVAYL